jgi:hypothetical protein
MPFDPDEFATSFVEWVYSNPGQPATEYAIELARRLREELTET